MDVTADNRKFPPHPSAGIEAIASDAIAPLRCTIAPLRCTIAPLPDG
jgi:hypothetical protein